MGLMIRVKSCRKCGYGQMELECQHPDGKKAPVPPSGIGKECPLEDAPHQNSPAVKAAIKAVFEELNAMSAEEFAAMLAKHEDGDIALALQYAWTGIHPDEKPDAKEDR